MRLSVFFVFVLCALFGLCEIRGVVLDGNDDSPVAGASVTAYSCDTTVVAKVVTGANGEFVITVEHPNVSIIEVSGIGFESKLVATDSLENPAVLRLVETRYTLPEILATGVSRGHDAVSETFFINDSLRALAGNAAMLIGKLPGIKVDWISENISIGDEKNVKMLVNGRERGLQYAKSLNPKRIRSIQIQRYPPGRFSDCPVLVNIELYDDYLGWDASSGFVSKVSLQNRHSNVESPYIDATLSVNNWNLYTSGTFKHTKGYEATSFYRCIADKYIEETLPPDRENPNFNKLSNETQHSIGADKKFGAGHVVSLQSWFEKIRHVVLEKYEMLDRVALSNKDSYSSFNSITGLFYNGRISDKFEAEATIQYNYYNIDELHTYSYGEISSISKSIGKKNYIYLSANTTYSISPKWEATIGYNCTWRNYHSGGGRVDDTFASEESRNKVDATISFFPTKRFNMRIGGSMLSIHDEQTHVCRSHTDWHPRMQLYWRPFDNVRLRAVYINETIYPNLDQLSTSSWEISSHIYQVGNPFLNSMTNNCVNTRVSIYDWLALEYMCRKSGNDIIEWYELLPDDNVRRTYTNCDYQHQYAGLSIDRNIAEAVNLYFVGNYQWYRRWNKDFGRYGRTWYADLTLTWNVGSSGLALLTEYLVRHDREPLPQGLRYNQEESLAVGCNYIFLKGKLSVSAVIAIPTQIIDKNTYTKIEMPGFKSTTTRDDRVNSLLAQINVRFNIGKGKIRRNTNTYITDTEK